MITDSRRFCRVCHGVLQMMLIVTIGGAATWCVARASRADAGSDASSFVQSGPLRFREQLVMEGYTYSYGIEAADIDGDGDLDITSADALPNNSLYWFENDGQGTFQKHFVQKDDPERLERHDVGDIDGDGDLDICIVKNKFGDLLWFENSGKPRDGQLWKRHIIIKGKLPGAYDVELVDLDGDGDLDVAASSWTPGSLFAWFENDGTPGDGEWTMRVIEENVRETRAILAGDIDGDGDPDLVGTASGAALVVWYENSGKPATVPFKKHVIDDKSLRPIHGDLVDMDGDGDLDVLMALGMSLAGPEEADTIAWYENDGGKGARWKKHIVQEKFIGAFEAVAADLDGDGDVDVVATGWGGPGRVSWFENSGDPRTGWKQHVIKDKWTRANQVIIADFDADGRPDIAAGAERGSNEVRWWQNLGTKK